MYSHVSRITKNLYINCRICYFIQIKRYWNNKTSTVILNSFIWLVLKLLNTAGFFCEFSFSNRNLNENEVHEQRCYQFTVSRDSYKALWRTNCAGFEIYILFKVSFYSLLQIMFLVIFLRFSWEILIVH